MQPRLNIMTGHLSLTSRSLASRLERRASSSAPPRLGSLKRALVLFSAMAAMWATGGLDAAPSRQTEPVERPLQWLQSLVGEWEGTTTLISDNPTVLPARATYYLTGDGTAVVENLFLGQHAMTSVYHEDGGVLRMSHFCAAGNQPRLKATHINDENRVITLELVDITNLSSPDAFHVVGYRVQLEHDQLVLWIKAKMNGTLREERVALARTETAERETSRVTRFDAAEVFERLKVALVGEWKGRLLEIDSPVEATYYLTGNASALVEDIRRPDKPASRMHTVYHLADEALRLTHYCSFRNQPRLIATAVSDGGRTIAFEMIDVTNLSRSGNRYTHKMVVSFPDRDHATITFVGLNEGQEGTLTAQLTRVP